MRIHTTVCKVDVGQSLDDLKKDMLFSLDYFNHRVNHEPVFGIFNGELYVAYPHTKTIEDIDRY